MCKLFIFIVVVLIVVIFFFIVMVDKFDWCYVEGGYIKMDFDDNEFFELDGLIVNGKYLLNSNWYLNGEYSFFEEGNFDFDMLILGVGYCLFVNVIIDVYFGVNLECIDGDVNDEIGYSINVGFCSMIIE